MILVKYLITMKREKLIIPQVLTQIVFNQVSGNFRYCTTLYFFLSLVVPLAVLCLTAILMEES